MQMGSASWGPGLGQLGVRAGVGARGGGEGRGRTGALCFCLFFLVLLSPLFCIPPSQIFPWHLWLVLSLPISLCIYPVLPCPFTACQLLFILVRTTDQRHGHPPSEQISISERAHFRGTHQIGPRTLPTGFFLQRTQSSPLLVFLSVSSPQIPPSESQSRHH